MTTGKDLDMTKTIARVVLTTLAMMTCLVGAFAMIGCSSSGQESGAQKSSGAEQAFRLRLTAAARQIIGKSLDLLTIRRTEEI